jgi:hypothetical protein
MVLMDAFVPPGYMAVGELLQLASQAILKEEWLEPIEFVARADRRRAAERPRGFFKAHRELRRAGGDSRIHPEFTALSETMQEWVARRRVLFDRLRLPLLTGAIPAAIKLATGQLVEVPAYFWQSDGAFRAFAKQEAAVDDGHGLQRQGHVLFKRTEAEEWLAGLDGPPAAMPGAMATATPEAMARDWFLAEVRSGEKRFGRDEYLAEMMRECGVSKRVAYRIWANEAPESWKKPGAPRRS